MRPVFTTAAMVMAFTFALAYVWPDDDYHSAAQADAINDVEQQARVELAEIQITRGIR